MTDKNRIRVGSRDSALAVVQSKMAIAAMQNVCPETEFELITMKTTGDKVLDRPLDAVGGKTFAQGLNDRNAPGHGRFIGNNDALGAGGGEDFVAVVRQKRFVGGNDVLSGGNRGQDVAFGRFNAAHEFDRNVNFGVVYDRMPVTGHGGFGAHLGAGLLETAAHHGLHAKLHAASLRQNRRVFL